MTIEAEFLGWAARKLEQHAGRIRHCVNRLSEQQIWLRGSESENAAGNLILHLCGNLRQWIGFGVAGLADIRRRDEEFDARGDVGREELLRRLDTAVAEVLATLRSLPPERLAERTRVQNYDVSVLEAVAHVVEHFGYHTGQIVFATKAFTGEDLGFYAHLQGRGAGTGPGPAKTP